MEPLYRRNQDGMMTEVVPQAQGKAAALSSYLAQGGTPFRKSGRFKKGPMKGKNVDEATAEFERLWASSPDSLKQKYANRTSGAMTDLAPSERATVATPARSNKPAPKTAAPVLDAVQAGVVAPKTAITPGSDEARAAALTETSRNERFATADIGAGGLAAASALERQFPSLAGVETPPAVATPTKPVRKPMMLGGSVGASYGQTITTPATSSSPTVQKELEKKQESERMAREQGYKAKKAADDAAFDASEYKRLGVTPASTVGGESAPNVDAGSALARQFPSLASAGSPAGPAAPTQITPATPARGINRATGLPFGYRPGDAVAPAQQTAAAESVTRQATASLPRATPVKPTFLSQSAINRPRTTTEGVEGRAAAEMRRQAGINANPATKNLDDPRKFFTGRTLPLDQLVKKQKTQTVMAQPPRALPIGTMRR